MAQRLSRQHVIDQQRRRLGHPPAPAATAEPRRLHENATSFSALPALAAHAQKPVLESPALQIGFELFIDVARQRPPLTRALISEQRVVLCDE